MTRTTSARIAGFSFLLYIAAGVASMVVHTSRAGVSVLFTLLNCFSALVLAVTLHRLTRAVDEDIAMLGLVCRVAEGILGAIYLPVKLTLRTLETAAGPSGSEAVHVLEAIVPSARALNTVLGATFFAVGSALFCWLFLRGRLIPLGLAWLGVLASVLLMIGLPMQLAGVLGGSIAGLMWLPMAAFEIPVGIWLLARGVATPERAP